MIETAAALTLFVFLVVIIWIFCSVGAALLGVLAAAAAVLAVMFAIAAKDGDL